MRKGWIVLIVVVLLVAVVTLVSWNRRENNEPQPVAEDVPERIVLVDAVPVSRGDLFRSTNLNVSFQPQSSVPIVPKVSGTVAEVHVAVGDRDRKSTRLNSSHVRISYAV